MGFPVICRGDILVCLVAGSMELPRQEAVDRNTILPEYAIRLYYSYTYICASADWDKTGTAYEYSFCVCVRPSINRCWLLVCCILGIGVMYRLSSFPASRYTAWVTLIAPDSSPYKHGIEGPSLELLKGGCYFRGERTASAAAGASVYAFSSARPDVLLSET